MLNICLSFHVFCCKELNSLCCFWCLSRSAYILRRLQFQLQRIMPLGCYRSKASCVNKDACIFMLFAVVFFICRVILPHSGSQLRIVLFLVIPGSTLRNNHLNVSFPGKSLQPVFVCLFYYFWFIFRIIIPLSCTSLCFSFRVTLRFRFFMRHLPPLTSP